MARSSAIQNALFIAAATMAIIMDGVGVAAFSPLTSSRTRTLRTTCTTTTTPASSSTSLSVMSRSRSGRTGQQDRSKRQERVGHLVRTELSRILHTGNIKGDASSLESELRQRVSVVSADVSPDLRQARITISVRPPPKSAPESNSVVDKRRAYSWLVENTKPIRHTLAQKMSHMKSCPNLSFVQVDVAAAVDVMYLIDKVASGAKRDKIDFTDGAEDFLEFDEEEDDDDDDDDDEEWEEIDDEFFK